MGVSIRTWRALLATYSRLFFISESGVVILQSKIMLAEVSLAFIRGQAVIISRALAE